MQTIVIGHRNPDMDSICSAIGYAELKRLTGMPNVIAARAGSTNERIDFVLNKFGVESPMLVSDLHPRVADVMARDVISITVDSSIYEAVQVIELNQMRGLPVVGPNRECVGLLSAFKVLHHLFPPNGEAERARVVQASLAEITRTFGGHTLAGEACCKVEPYRLVVGAMSAESFEERLHRYHGGVVVIVGDREEIQLAAIRGKVRALVVTGGLPVSDAVYAAAAEHGVTIIGSPRDTATTMLLARGAANVEQKVETEYLSFAPDTLLADAREAAAASGQFVFPVIEDGRLVGILSKSDFIKTAARQLILVDHNELSQAVAGAGEVTIVEILDHHRLGGYASDTPILFWNNPVGSTSTIVAMCYRQRGIEIPKAIAGLLMAGLISDTLNLTSPTATPEDAEILRHLSAIASVDPATLATEIFSVGSPLLTMSPEQAVTADCKEFTEEGVRFSVAQIEELSFSHFRKKEKELSDALDRHCRANGYLFSALLVTDINTKTSILLVSGSKAFLDRIDYPRLGANQWELEGVVSRKKQLLPYLLGCLHGLERTE